MAYSVGVEALSQSIDGPMFSSAAASESSMSQPSAEIFLNSDKSTTPPQNQLSALKLYLFVFTGFSTNMNAIIGIVSGSPPQVSSCFSR